MKILVITQYYYPEVFRINDLTTELKAQGHEVVVLTGLPNYPSGKVFRGYCKWRDSFAGIEILRVPILPRGRGGALNLLLNYLSFVLSASLLGLPRLWRRRFDVCLVFATSPITAALPACFYRALSGCPVAIWIQDLWPEVVASVGMVRNPRIVGWIGRLVAWIYRHADKLLLQSESFRTSVRRWGGREDQIEYVPNWAESFYQPPPVASAPLPFRILFAGNMGRAQSLEVVLDAIEILKNQNANIEWHFIGEGSLKPWFEQQVNSRNLTKTVKIFARRPESEMPQTFTEYSALLASLSHDPVLSLVLPSKVQSGLACAMPLLACGEGELQRVIQAANCGLVSSPDDAQALAKNAVHLSRLSSSELQAMGASGRRYYEIHFDRQRTIGKMVSVLQSLADV